MVELEEIESPPREAPRQGAQAKSQGAQAKEPGSAPYATEGAAAPAAGLPNSTAPHATGRGDEASPEASPAGTTDSQAEPTARARGSAGPGLGTPSSAEVPASELKRGSATPAAPGSAAEQAQAQGSHEGKEAEARDFHMGTGSAPGGRTAAGGCGTTEGAGGGGEEEWEEVFTDAVEGDGAPAAAEGTPKAVDAGEEDGAPKADGAPESVGAPNADGAGEEEAAFTDALTEEELRKSAVAEAEGLKAQGNAAYGRREYAPAIELYAKALEAAPAHEDSAELRAVCHANQAMCLLCLEDYEGAVEACSAALALRPEYVKALLRRAQAYEKLDKLEEALADAQKALSADPGSQAARGSVRRLEPIVAEKREKLKEEMIGKLKELGNSILGNFGMSLDNFKAVQDPNTGSYSINFQS